MEFVAFLGADRENWGQLIGLMNHLEYEKMIVVKSSGVSGFPSNSKSRIVEVDSSKPLIELKDELMRKLKPELSGDFEVFLSIASGSGKEHMALISALLSIPVGIRFVAFTKKGVEFVN